MLRSLDLSVCPDMSDCSPLRGRRPPRPTRIAKTVSDESTSGDRELLARLAYRYYIDELTQAEIGREFTLSRPKVQRLLDRARRSGIVEIRIAQPPGLHLEIEAGLRSAFGLADAIVTAAHMDPQSQREAVARSAAQYLERRLLPGGVVAVGMGRNTGQVAAVFRPARRLDCTFVSAMGGSPSMDAPTNPNEICRALANGCGGRAESLYAPAYVASHVMRDQLRQQDAVSHTLQIAAGAAVALVGIGGADDDCTTIRSGCCTLEEMARLRANGAVGDILANYFDLSGRVISSDLYGRLIGLTLAELRDIETVVAVVSEREKAAAVLGALRTGVVDVLVVDETNAVEVLAAAQASPT